MPHREGWLPLLPKVGGKPAKQVKPLAPTGCKLLGTVKGTKLWAGDCAGPSELRVRHPLSSPPSKQIPPLPNNSYLGRLRRRTVAPSVRVSDRPAHDSLRTNRELAGHAAATRRCHACCRGEDRQSHCTPLSVCEDRLIHINSRDLFVRYGLLDVVSSGAGRETSVCRIARV
jgi:hypothetical protein